MNRKNAALIYDLQNNGKFLARHRSPPLLQFCFCCTHPETEEAGETFLEQSTTIPTSKISIKQIIKRNRSAQGISNQYWKRNNVNRSQQQKRTQLSGFKRYQFRNVNCANNQKILHCQINQMPLHIPHKICFTYDNKVKKISHPTTNRTVSQMTSRSPTTTNPEETKKQIQKAKQNQITIMSQFEKEFNDVLDSKQGDSSDNHENQSKQSITGKQPLFITPQKTTKEMAKFDNDVNMGNFSFGHRQKTHFMSKYMNQTTLRQPQTIKELKQSLLQLQSKYLSNESVSSNKVIENTEKHIQFMRGTFNKKGMMNFIHRIQTVSQDMVISDSQQSVVIDDFHSIMDNMKKKKRREQQNSQKFHNSEKYP